jgi:hypothetical protein
MRNKLFTALLLSLFVIQACVKDEEKVFDTPAIERMKAAMQTCKATLCAAPDGWVMEYYPEINRTMGGYNFICKFNNDGTVQMAGEAPTANYPTGYPATSTYDIIANKGALLTFNTYNEVLHYFVESRGPSDVDGYAGDYEFVIRNTTPGQITMTGKKYGHQVVLTPYSGGDTTTWKGYLEHFNTLYRKMYAPVYEVTVNGAAAAVKKVTRKFRTFQFTYDNPEDNKTVPYLMTPTGIKLYEPLTIDGETAQYFTFDATARTLTSVEPGNHIVIKLGVVL